MSAPPTPPEAGLLPRLRVGQWLGVTIGLLLTFAAAGVVLGLVANHRLDHQRAVVLDQVEPALIAALELETALVNQETGVRGYQISRNPGSLEPYHSGRAAAAAAYRELEHRDREGGSKLSADLGRVRARVRSWQVGYTAPELASVAASRPPRAPLAGRHLFDGIRASLGDLRSDLDAKLAHARTRLSSDARLLDVVLYLAAALIIGSVLASGLLLRRIVSRPLEALGTETARVAAGEFAHPMTIPSGPREIVDLGVGVETMRQRIVRDLETTREARGRLEVQALELERSNLELEQFAYVASHDLQEPLRKVASFCQALQRRYEGQLDERADQYIEFAVDGAKRMQALINDLLAFSRVGRATTPHEAVPLDGVLSQAVSSLSELIEGSGATVLADELPVVAGERSLLVSLFGNLITNAVKFRGSEPPVVHFQAHRDGGHWEISATDNGIGVEAQYAEKIFVIFQRLHSKETYPGTGIGLAMCRKIVEHHGGRMWLATEHRPGAEFRFTLPVAEGNKEEEPWRPS